MRSKPGMIADVIGVAHFVLANALVVIGQFNPAFEHYGGFLPGLRFVYLHIDTPVYQLFQGWADGMQQDFIYTIAIAQFIIVLSSVFYAAIAYFVVWLLLSIVD